jgi:two-component sensor histidine kinase
MVEQMIRAARRGPGGWWLPVRWWVSLSALFVFLLGVTWLTYELARSREELTLHSLAEADAIAFTRRFQTEIDDQLRAFRRIKWTAVSGRFRNMEELKAAAIEFQQKNRFCLEVGQAEASGRVTWVWPGEAGSMIPQDLNKHEEWAIAFKASRTNARDIAAMWLNKSTNPQFLALVMPLSVGDEGRNEPMLVARVTPLPLLERMMDGRIRDNHHIEISDGTVKFYQVGSDGSRRTRHWEEQMARFANRYWQVKLWPMGAQIASRMTGLDRLILVSGIVVACLMTLAFYQVLRYRAWEMRQTERHMAALESLNEIATAISGRPGSGREIMHQLADAARRLLGMSRSIFTLLDAKNYCMRTYASAGDIPAGAPPVFHLEHMPVMRRCLIGGDVMFAEDMKKVSEPVNWDMVKAYDCTAMMMIPLRVENRSIGMMALSDSKPRKFTDADKRLARLLGAQASVILAKNELYEQMREGLERQKQLVEQSGRDAQAKAILLRELHHRVKNNLAGIVGLLSMHEPDLTPSARQWLERVRERIGTMARAHDLFSGGIEQVNLQQLVKQVLPSLSVLTPPGVMVKVNAGVLDVTFDTSRAVSLAMVLHELCTNALLHGLDGKGTLTISARRTESGAIIEVSDEGGTAAEDAGTTWMGEAMGLSEDDGEVDEPWDAAATVTAVQQGTGLYLVRELVRRELKGTVRLRRGTSGGTIATIEVPLETQEK